jgi:hypothetical protein
VYDAVAVLFLLVVIVGLLIALDVQIAATERAWADVAAWRQHHIATLQSQHAWFREQWRRVNGERARPQPTPRETPLAKRAAGESPSDTGRYRLAELLEPRPGDTVRTGPPTFDPRDTVDTGPPPGCEGGGVAVSHQSLHRPTPAFPS